MTARAAKAQHPVIDAHAHVFRPASVFPRGVDDLVPADRDAPIEDLLQLMDVARVDAAVLVPLDTHDDYIAAVLREYPTRLAAVAVARPCELGVDRDSAGRVGPRALDARRAGFGFGALRTSWLGPPDEPVSSSPALPLLRHLADLGLALWTYLPPDQLPLLKHLLEAVPGLPVVLNHLGFCPHDMQVDEQRRPRFSDPFPATTINEVQRLAAYPSVHVMLSGQYALSASEPPYRDLHEIIRRVVEAYGPQRCLWASDFPWTRDVPGYATLLEHAPAALPHLTGDDLAWLFGRTALSLFPTLAPHLQELR